MNSLLLIRSPTEPIYIPITKSVLDYVLFICDREFADDPSYSRNAIEALPLTEAIKKTALMLYNHPTFNPKG